jgi:transposase InsO family protein
MAPPPSSTAQGSQFTRLAFPRLLRDHGIASSMDGRGAGRDTVFGERLWRSVNYEEVYLRADDTVSDARASSAISGLLQYRASALEPCPQASDTACFNALRPIAAAAEPRQKST